jgi:hypothetical protein
VNGPGSSFQPVGDCGSATARRFVQECSVARTSSWLRLCGGVRVTSGIGQRRSAERSPLDATQRPSGEKATLEDYTEAVRQRARDPRFPRDVVEQPPPGFPNVVVHEYVALDLRRVVEALDRLEPVERFLEIVRSIEA